ncbi:HAMP domain-containing sensor histidine kinase [Caulobacter sp. FWC26]|uniref:sensor histidine kinase n=1 Tax=Caulobacter sp. FWC26 TaxID=69665 RepID=UPI000C14E3EA|nr:HAMP domain-containing sensor histidine kinase [Caulobacter sp. FWC26]AZS21578.1 sensor histidine kinase [Caulobacter sp. FWC26]
MLRSTSLRLAVLYTLGFALSVVLLGALTLYSTRAALSEQFDARIRAEAAALTQEFATEGLDGVVQAVRERDRTPGALDYGLIGPDGRPLAGRFPSSAAKPGWATLAAPQRDGEVEPVRVLTTPLPGGYHLIVGDDEERIEALDTVVLQGFAGALIGVVILGVVGGLAFSRDVHRRLSAISGTAEAIIDGDLTRRVPARGSSDDIDRLAHTFNRMLDRIGALMESLRQVSNDVAHDLRTPLTRLRQRLEAAQSAPAEQAEAIDGALSDLDSILETFAALLRIAQIEGGARRAAFRQVRLRDLAATVVDAFAPSAEEGGRSLRLEAGEDLVIEGDTELLTQMLVNLVENALRHTGEGAQVRVGIDLVDRAPVLWVADNGPGVPTGEHARLFDRFYRLERSRSAPGSGLGLALVAAVAKLHEASVRLSDAEPGLRAEVVFLR